MFTLFFSDCAPVVRFDVCAVENGGFPNLTKNIPKLKEHFLKFLFKRGFHPVDLNLEGNFK